MTDPTTPTPEPRTDRYERDTRFQIDRYRRWTVSELTPDMGDGCPGTVLRDPTDEEWTALFAQDEAVRDCEHPEAARRTQTEDRPTVLTICSKCEAVLRIDHAEAKP